MTTQRTFYCPCCGQPADVVQVDVQHGDIGDTDITWKRVHLECLGKCPVLWSCVDIPNECLNDKVPTIPLWINVDTVDNRDSRTTWLWINGDTEYIEIDPVDLIQNMVENCAHVITDPTLIDGETEIPVTADELNEALSILRRV